MFSPSKKFVPQLHMASSTGIMLLPNGVSEYSIRPCIGRMDKLHLAFWCEGKEFTLSNLLFTLSALDDMLFFTI